MYYLFTMNLLVLGNGPCQIFSQIAGTFNWRFLQLLDDSIALLSYSKSKEYIRIESGSLHWSSSGYNIESSVAYEDRSLV